MINEGHNFGRRVKCPLGCQNDDHITQCNVIKQSCFDVMMHNIDIDVIYKDKEKIKTAVKVFEGAFRTRQELIEELQ
jgi:hypothetical protein